ncbi:Carbon-nitrogen hydrolase [Coemansia sp. RSA 487]|nr:Carbon-nitrogen hydrolase [Coemansia sp. RSA 1843]KAJ2212494.1 Carbon-nitrogen hydrolase [Coemansia sp. RSA 487]
MADRLARRGEEEYEANGSIKISDVAAGVEDAVSSATTMAESMVVHAVASKGEEEEEEDGDYDMVEHHEADEHEGEDGGDLEDVEEEEYAAEQVEYADYEMADTAMEQDAEQVEYVENVAETDAGSILATQEHAEHHIVEETDANGAGSNTVGHHEVEYGGYAQEEGVDKEHQTDGMSVDEDGHVVVEDQQQQHNGHEGGEAAHSQAGHSHGMYDDQGDQSSQIYDSNHADGGPMEYTMISSDDAANSSLAALSRAISSNVRQLTGEVDTEDDQRLQQHRQREHDDDQHDHARSGHRPQEHSSHDQQDDELPPGGYDDGAQEHTTAQPSTEPGSNHKTPVRFKTQARRLAEAEGPRSVTPIKRRISRSQDAQTSSRLKSKVWGWYEILPDGYRQCKFCPQRYGRLTATTILARHFHNRHDANASPSTTPTASRRPAGLSTRRPRQPSHSRGSQRVITLPNGQVIDMTDPDSDSAYNQAAVAAAAAAAAAAEADFRASADDQPGTGDGAASAPLFQVQGNGDAAYGHDSADEVQRSESQATQHSPFDDNPLIVQGGFSAMMASPLSRLGLAPARSAIAAVAQFCAQGDIRKNMQTCVDLIGGAARRGAQMVFLPEASDFIADSRDLTSQLAQSVDGEFMKEIQQAAKDNGIWVSIGIHEQPPTNEMPYNTNAVVSNEGVLVSVYRKLHMFDVNVKDGPRLLESTTTTRGDRISEVVDTPVGRLGSSVCYDLRFPELAQTLRLQGAQLLSYPSAFTELTGAAHWEMLLRARAVETQTYVFGAAQIGRHNSRRSSYGDAMIVDPWGTVLARCARNTNEPTLATAEINLEYLDKIRREMPVFNHKRTDLFPEYAA